MTRQISHQSGYTLVELLIVLVLFGFLSILMASGYGLVIDRWQRVDAQGNAGLRRQIAEGVIRDRLTHAYPGLLGERGTSRIVAFNGTADGTDFLGPLPERFGAPAIVFYTIRIQPDGTLHLAWRLDQGDPEDTVLLSGLDGGSFAYFGAAAPGADRLWSDHWTNQTTLPDLVRVRLFHADGLAHSGPDLVVAPLVTASIDCRFDPADGKCR